MAAIFENTTLPDIIEFKNINQSYGNKVVLKDVNMLIEDIPAQGQFVVILGKSGCGKSTLLRYIAGLQTPTSGEIIIESKKQNGQIKVGMVFQKYSSLPWLTVKENVALGMKFHMTDKKEISDKADELLELVNLSEHSNKFAQYPNLSGGQLQRVAIARSLATNPSILLMDEPFGALDVHTRWSMQQLLAKMWLKIDPTIIFVTHDVQEAVFLADEIWIMSANPGTIQERIKINLPKERVRELKRDSYFVQQVYEIEDKLFS